MEYINKNSKTGNDSRQQKGCLSRPQFKKSKGHAPSFAIAHAPRNRGEYSGRNSQHFKARQAQPQGSLEQGVSRAPTCAMCGRNHPGYCHNFQAGYLK